MIGGRDQTLLLIDCHCSDAVEAERVLYPLIQEIEARKGRPIGLIPYNEGWAMLAGRIAELGWWESFRAPIVRVDSAGPFFRSTSHVLLNIADLVIRSTK